MRNPNHLPKHNIPVRVALIDGSHVFGVVYVRQGQRVIDMICEERVFFPLRSNDCLSLINKQSVVKIEILSLDDIASKSNLFPGINTSYLMNNNW